MQVSAVETNVTHAVIGGKKQIEFGISNSAEFFHILSSTLYKDQILAVVREVLCNAWDAHIAAGVTDKPIEVTISNGKLTIRDHGFGIHDDNIGPVYGTYGNSTKKNDGMQTGGFGLGCKAPFAYADHFDVTSNHKGMKTIYAMSKSSAKVAGKPEIETIVSFPTTDTGMEVSLQIQQKDHERFYNLIKMIIRNGEMNATINGKEAVVFPFSQLEHGFLISPESFEESGSHVCVRYGNVIYPIDSHEQYAAAYKEVLKSIKANSNNSYQTAQLYIVLQAPPHSISVQPSREGLSMQSHTVDTISKLFDSYLTVVKRDGQHALSQVVIDTVDKAWKEEKYPEIFTQFDRLAGKYEDRELITNMYALNQWRAFAFYPSQHETLDLSRRIENMVSSQFGNRGLVQTFRRMYESVKDNEYGQSDAAFRWFHERVVGPINRGMAHLNVTGSLRVIGHRSRRDSGEYHMQGHNSTLSVHAYEIHAPIEHFIPYLRNIVVLTTRKDGIWEKMKRFPQLNQYGNRGGMLVYICGRKAEDVDKARLFFQAKGYVLLDLTVRQPWDAPEPVKVARVVKKKQPGLPCLSNAFMPPTAAGYRAINLLLCREETATRLIKPEFITKLRQKEKDQEENQMQMLPLHTRESTQAILQLFGSVGAIYANETQAALLQKEGVKLLDDFLKEKVLDEVGTNQRILDYLSFAPSNFAASNPAEIELIKMFFDNESLATKLGLPFNLTTEDRLYLLLWNKMVDDNHRTYRPNQDATITAATDRIKALPIHPEALKAVKQMTDNKMLSLIDVDRARRLVSANGAGVDKSKIDSLCDILLLALQS